MYQVSDEFLEAIDSGAIHHIRGKLFDVSGAETELGSDIILGQPVIESQCVEDSEIFNIAELYVGTLEIKLNVPDTRYSDLIGGEIELEFGLDTANGREWIPLGVWDISSADRESGGILSITGVDHINRLNVSSDDNSVGIITLEVGIRRVENAAEVVFAQSVEEIAALIPGRHNLWGTHYSETCRDEVRAISQLIGGFAFANREGKIEFRKFGREPVLTIPAEKRFNIKLSENPYGVKAFAYIDKYGHTTTHYLTTEVRTAVIALTNNRYIWDQEDNYESYYDQFLTPLVDYFTPLKWTPGTVDYYGNPALDIGDLVTLEGGINEQSTNFLICSNTWQFRGPQTLISAGAPSIGGSVVSASESSGGSVYANTQINVTKTISTVKFTPRCGILFDTERAIAVGQFSCKSQTHAFVECSMVLLGTESALVAASVYFDEEKQPINPKITLIENERAALSFTLPITANGGEHTIKITALGLAELLEINACVWGQNISAEPLKLDGGDYDFTVSGGEATVTGYHGDSVSPEIPEQLGRGVTTVIDKKSFTDSEIESIYIPEGVTEIR